MFPEGYDGAVVAGLDLETTYESTTSGNIHKSWNRVKVPFGIVSKGKVHSRKCREPHDFRRCCPKGCMSPLHNSALRRRT
jgi:hypothetical protein